jgi:hypothetical protein
VCAVNVPVQSDLEVQKLLAHKILALTSDIKSLQAALATSTEAKENAEAQLRAKLDRGSIVDCCRRRMPPPELACSCFSFTRSVCRSRGLVWL